ncbi:MAG: DUF599 family protein [Pseudomonadota bacterium]
MPPLDLAVFVFFILCWLFYEPVLKMLARGPLLNSDMTVIRGAWMGQMARREVRLMDANLLGHALNSASFFASSNLLLIAAAAGALFGGESTFASVSSLEVIKTSSRVLFEGQLALVMVVLARGLLDFIWSIRQMNYSLTIMGATPDGEHVAPGTQAAFASAATRVLNPALSSFNAGVRGYYFALAAAAWLFGPVAFVIATLGAMTLLIWRQRHSPSARAIRDLRKQLEAGSVDP